MYDFTSPDFWVVALIGLVTGGFLGWLITSLVQRRAGAGASVVQLRKEMEDYREEVNSHFARTAELFKDTTEKYRDLYEHLAGGAQELCNDLPDRTRVEFKPGHLLAAHAPDAGEQPGSGTASTGPGRGAAKTPGNPPGKAADTPAGGRDPRRARTAARAS